MPSSPSKSSKAAFSRKMALLDLKNKPTDKKQPNKTYAEFWRDIRKAQLEKPLSKYVQEQVDQYVVPPVGVITFEENSKNLQEFHKTLDENPTPIPSWNGARILPQYGLTDGFPVWEKKLKSSIKGFYEYSNVSLWRFNGTTFVKIGHETGSAKYVGPRNKIRF